MSKYDCIIVGSGINALVCAAILSKKGNKVLVLERNDRLGGCIRTDEITAPGFVHDVLSSWHPLFVTSPGYAELKDDLEKYGLEYCNTDSPTAVVLPDQTAFILKNSREENVGNMNAFASGDGDRYAAAMAELEQSLGLTFTLLGSELWRGSTLKVLLSALVKMGPFKLAQYFGGGLQPARAWLDTTFSSNAVSACLAGWPSHAGIGPDAPASALMAQVIAFTLEMVGCPVVKGGNYNIVRAFEQVIEANGGELEVNADVTKVITENGRATGVKTRDGNEYRGGTVICSVTPNQLYPAIAGSCRRAGGRSRADPGLPLRQRRYADPPGPVGAAPVAGARYGKSCDHTHHRRRGRGIACNQRGKPRPAARRSHYRCRPTGRAGPGPGTRRQGLVVDTVAGMPAPDNRRCRRSNRRTWRRRLDRSGARGVCRPDHGQAGGAIFQT